MPSPFIRPFENGDASTAGIAFSRGEFFWMLKNGQKQTLNIDLSDFMETGDTIAASTWTPKNITVASPTISGKTVSAAVTGVNSEGELDITATLSDGDIVTVKVHTRPQDTLNTPRDYAGRLY